MATDAQSSLQSRDEFYQEKIELFFPFLQDTLRASHLLCLLHLEEVKKVSHKIHKLENDGEYSRAAVELLEAIKRSEELGRWQMFIDAVREDGACIILNTLFDDKEGDTWHREHRTMIGIFSKTITDVLNLEAILPTLLQEDLIDSHDIEKLSAMIRRGETRAAIGLMLILIHRRQPNWYNQFLTILINNKFPKLAKEIDPDRYQKIMDEKAKQHDVQSERASGETGTLSEPHPQPAGAIAKPSHSSRHAHTTSGAEKNMRAPSLAEHHGAATTARESTCTCQGCARLIAEVASLRNELVDVVAALKSALGQVASLRSEMA